MPVVLLAGIPRRAFRRREFVEPSIHIDNWTVEVFGSEREDATVSRCWHTLQVRVAAIDANEHSQGVHILAFDRDERGFAASYAAPMRDHHRIRLLPMPLIQHYGTETFNGALTALARIEQEWLANLRPTNSNEPVILPEGHFEVPTPFDAVWHRVRDYDGSQNLSAIQSLVSNFKVRYRAERYRDVRGLLFDPRGARHALTRDATRNWKFGMRLPNSFHFDVTDERKRPFGFRCREQGRQTYNTHCNIDAFGFEVAAANH